jgi:hypothetical protein
MATRSWNAQLVDGRLYLFDWRVPGPRPSGYDLTLSRIYLGAGEALETGKDSRKCCAQVHLT